jgi:hypothetical protein
MAPETLSSRVFAELEVEKARRKEPKKSEPAFARKGKELDGK